MKRAEGQPTKTAKRKSSGREKVQPQNLPDQLGNHVDVIALRERISQLEVENKDLREQVAALTNNANRPVQSHKDPVREQRHNFFKYSNIRRY